MGSGKRRNKGKQWSHRSAPSGAPTTATTADDAAPAEPPVEQQPPEEEEEEEEVAVTASQSQQLTAAEDTASAVAPEPTVPPPTLESASGAGRSGNNDNQQEENNAAATTATMNTATPPSPAPVVDNTTLVLTSEKRRGIFECDYCHSDISQLPRIRCAVCPDFDLCLDCFASTSNETHNALAKLKVTEQQQQSGIVNADIGGDATAATSGGGGDGNAAGEAGSGNGVVVSSGNTNHHHIQHDADTHGYRVCDSTRYPLFPPAPRPPQPKRIRTRSPPPVSVSASAKKLKESNSSNDKEQQEEVAASAAGAAFGAGRATTGAEETEDVVPVGISSTKKQQDSAESTAAAAADATTTTADTSADVTANSSVVVVDNDDKAKDKDTKDEDKREEEDEEQEEDGFAESQETMSTATSVSATNTPACPSTPATAATPVAASASQRLQQLQMQMQQQKKPEYFIYDDPRTVWTIEEDLRLIEAVRCHGLGNWYEISETVSGQGSSGKTPRRCMERYLDDFLGRYGHILPQYTYLPADINATTASTTNETATATAEGEEMATNAPDEKEKPTAVDAGGGGGADNNDESAANSMTTTDGGGEIMVRASKRRAVLMRSPSGMSQSSALSLGGSNHSVGGVPFQKRRFQVVPTESLPEYSDVWPEPRYLPPPEPPVDVADQPSSGAPMVMWRRPQVKIGEPVLREQSLRAEQSWVRTISAIGENNPDQLERIKNDWRMNRLGKPGGPTALPIRPETDLIQMPGAEVAGFMPRRGDFDVEWENDAETAIADMEFLPRESAADRELKLRVLQIYNNRLDERERRKEFVLSRGLYDYHNYESRQKLTKDERDLTHRMRLFERFHTPAEHKQFLADILKAKRLRKEIAKLQMYHRLGIRTLAEAERYELDKSRRLFHKTSVQQKQAEAVKVAAASHEKVGGAGASATGDSKVAGGGGTVSINATEETVSSSLWKQYRTADRKIRKSVNRGGTPEVTATATNVSTDTKNDEPTTVKSEHDDKTEEAAAATTAAADPMDVDEEEKPTKTASSSLQESEKMEVDDDAAPAADAAAAAGEAETPAEQLQLASMPGYGLLLPREIDLCEKLRLTPLQYQDIKASILQESLSVGLLDKETQGSSKRTLVKIDAERRGDVIDFFISAGWITTKRPFMDSVNATTVAVPGPPPENQQEEAPKATNASESEPAQAAGTKIIAVNETATAAVPVVGAE